MVALYAVGDNLSLSEIKSLPSGRPPGPRFFAAERLVQRSARVARPPTDPPSWRNSVMSNLVSVPVVQRTLLLAIALILLATPLFCQQAYVSRYDLFTGYTYLN